MVAYFRAMSRKTFLMEKFWHCLIHKLFWRLSSIQQMLISLLELHINARIEST